MVDGWRRIEDVSWFQLRLKKGLGGRKLIEDGSSLSVSVCQHDVARRYAGETYRVSESAVLSNSKVYR